MVKQAKQGFTCRVDGKRRYVGRGELVADKDPVVKGREAFFDDAVETADKAPGERKRSRRQAPSSTSSEDEDG